VGGRYITKQNVISELQEELKKWLWMLSHFANTWGFRKWIIIIKLQEGRVGLFETRLLYDDIQVCVPGQYKSGCDRISWKVLILFLRRGRGRRRPFHRNFLTELHWNLKKSIHHSATSALLSLKNDHHWCSVEKKTVLRQSPPTVP